MCDVNGPFKLCTCESIVDESKPHWVLHRHLQNKEEVQIMGLYNQPDPYTTISERSLQRRMNSSNVFDFEYSPEEGDYIELFLNPTIEYDEDGEAYEEEFHPEYTLEFRKSRWQLLEPFEKYIFEHKQTQSGEIKGPKSELTIAYENFKKNISEDQLHKFQYFSNHYIDPMVNRTKKGLIEFFKKSVSE